MKIINWSDIKAVLFDMDGTMVDNNVFHMKAFQEFCRRHGYDLSEEEFKTKLSGKRNSEILRNMFGKDITDEQIKQYGDDKEAIYREMYAPHIKPVEGLHDFIQTLKKRNIKVAVATSGQEKNRRFVFEKLGFLDTFDVVTGEEHIVKGKPDPEIFLNTADKLGVSPKHCLVFEDSPSGVKGAKNAGMKVIGLSTTHTEEELREADGTIKNFSEINM